jgi:hypothetical protein
MSGAAARAAMEYRDATRETKRSGQGSRLAIDVGWVAMVYDGKTERRFLASQLRTLDKVLGGIKRQLKIIRESPISPFQKRSMMASIDKAIGRYDEAVGRVLDYCRRRGIKVAGFVLSGPEDKELKQRPHRGGRRKEAA